MMKMRLVAEKPSDITPEELIVKERVWRPARSLMAIANQKHIERTGHPIVEFDELHDIDENIGYGLDDDACLLLGEEMEALIDDPFALVDYGMTVDIENGNEFYTYPTDMCTAYFEDTQNGNFYASLNDEAIVGRRVRSWFRATKSEMYEVIAFLKTCGGFSMP